MDEAKTYKVTMEICGQTEVGPTRPQNQDAIMVAGATTAASGTRLVWNGAVEKSNIVAVIDGMGGYAGGSDAAALVATSLAGVKADQMSAEDWNELLETLSARVSSAGRAWGTPDMGATAAVLAFTPENMIVVNVGDCRVYRVVDGRLGKISVDDRSTDPNSSAVTQALGGSRNIDAHYWVQSYSGGFERYVLCSDGVWGTLDANHMRDLCSAKAPPSQVVSSIISTTYALRSSDNCSVIVVDLDAQPPDDNSIVQAEVLPVGVPTVEVLSGIEKYETSDKRGNEL